MKKYFNYLMVIIITTLIFLMPCRALDIAKLSIKVGSLELDLKTDKFSYGIITAFDKEEIAIKVTTDEDVEIIGDGLIKLETNVTNHDLKIIENQKEYIYHLKITKEDSPKNPDDFGLTVFFNNQVINDFLASNKTIIYNQNDTIYLNVRITNEDTQVTSKLGKYTLNNGKNTIPLTIKTNDEEYTYNINILKKAKEEKTQAIDINFIIDILKIICLILLIGAMIWLLKNRYFGFFIIFLLVFIFQIVFREIRVDGSSMENTLHDNEPGLTINSYFAKFKRGDIVVAYTNDFESSKKEYVIKRIIGLPHDNIRIKNNILYINGQEQKENYLKETMDTWDLEITLKDDEYFLMGDNRNHSADSRIYGAINKEEIKSKLLFK